MTYGYILLVTAQEEYESSLMWYVERSPQAAELFVEAIEYTLGLICEHPDRWRNEYRSYYEISVKRYPYSIIYTIDTTNEIVVVSSIYHHSRNPRKKYHK